MGSKVSDISPSKLLDTFYKSLSEPNRWQMLESEISNALQNDVFFRIFYTFEIKEGM